jgi:hypothetical protein
LIGESSSQAILCAFLPVQHRKFYKCGVDTIIAAAVLHYGLTAIRSQEEDGLLFKKEGTKFLITVCIFKLLKTV